jgi:hypothetical protein
VSFAARTASLVALYRLRPELPNPISLTLLKPCVRFFYVFSIAPKRNAVTLVGKPVLLVCEVARWLTIAAQFTSNNVILVVK